MGTTIDELRDSSCGDGGRDEETVIRAFLQWRSCDNKEGKEYFPAEKGYSNEGADYGNEGVYGGEAFSYSMGLSGGAQRGEHLEGANGSLLRLGRESGEQGGGRRVGELFRGKVYGGEAYNYGMG